jgi:DNA-binding LacI/PurR family transcriptional regulator
MSTMRRSPTMKDVAQRAAVSIQTVSAVINDKPGITPGTQTRVLAAIRDLGYRPYSVARSLRTGRTRTLAFIVSDIANPSLATMAGAAEEYAATFGYSLVLYNTHGDPTREASYIQTATQRGVDGALFVSTADQVAALDAFETVGIPLVAIDRIPLGHAGPSVTLDNVAAGRLAAEHLLALGHKCIAHIGGPMHLRLSRERLTGFETAIRASGLEPGPIAASEGHWDCETGYRAMRRILGGPILPTAIFAANDRMAMGAMRALFEAGLRVPADVSVVGVDDIEVAAFQIPPLTTVRQPFAELAVRAVELLIARLEDRVSERPQVIIEPQLVVRLSTTHCGS